MYRLARAQIDVGARLVAAPAFAKSTPETPNLLIRSCAFSSVELRTFKPQVHRFEPGRGGYFHSSGSFC